MKPAWMGLREAHHRSLVEGTSVLHGFEQTLAGLHPEDHVLIAARRKILVNEEWL
jgi:hypothetical protein